MEGIRAHVIIASLVAEEGFTGCRTWREKNYCPCDPRTPSPEVTFENIGPLLIVSLVFCAFDKEFKGLLLCVTIQGKYLGIECLDFLKTAAVFEQCLLPVSQSFSCTITVS